MAEPFPFYIARGTHREVGRQQGEQARDRIRGHLESVQRSTGLGGEAFEARAMAFMPLFSQHCPHLLEEIEGLADGAGVLLSGALAVNIRGALGAVPDEGCTAFAVGREGTAVGEVLIGQNSDMLAEFGEYAYVLRLEPEDKPALLIWTFGGMIGYHGLNSAGVAQMANDLGEGGPAKRFALPHYPVKRMMLECTSLRQVEALLRRVPLWFNGNYMLADGYGAILDIEATSAGPELIPDNGRGYLAHSNHYCSPRYATDENAAATYADSFPRLDRMNAILAGEYGAITVDTFKAALADHDGHPSSICRHATNTSAPDFEMGGVTVAGIIAEPERGLLHVSAGKPCDSTFTTYSLNG